MISLMARQIPNDVTKFGKRAELRSDVSSKMKLAFCVEADMPSGVGPIGGRHLQHQADPRLTSRTVNVNHLGWPGLAG